MKINITLLAQIVNFYITYYLLDKFVFKNAIQSINDKKKAEDKLVRDVEKKETLFLQREKSKKEDLLSFQKKIRANYSTQKPAPIKIEANLHEKKNPDKIKTLTTKIKNLIIKEIPRVR